MKPQISYTNAFHAELSELFPYRTWLRACLHGGGGPQYWPVGEVTRLGRVTRLSNNLLYGHPTYHVNVIKLKWEIIWTGGLPHLSRLPHLPGVPYLHVNRPISGFPIITESVWKFLYRKSSIKPPRGAYLFQSHLRGDDGISSPWRTRIQSRKA